MAGKNKKEAALAALPKPRLLPEIIAAEKEIHPGHPLHQDTDSNLVVPETRWLKNAEQQRFFYEETIEHYEDHQADLAAILAAAGRA